MIIEWLQPVMEWTGLSVVAILLLLILIVIIIKS